MVVILNVILYVVHKRVLIPRLLKIPQSCEWNGMLGSGWSGNGTTIRQHNHYKTIEICIQHSAEKEAYKYKTIQWVDTARNARK